MKTANFPLLMLLLFLTISINYSCKVYSLTGASVSPDLKTVSIEPFINKSQNGNTFITQDLTDKFKNRVLQETPLTLILDNGDLHFKGTLTGYNVSSQAPTGGNALASLNRLTLTIKIECTNKKNEEKSWEKSFNRFADFPATSNLVQVERDLINNINVQLADDIFNESFVNW